MLYLRRNLNACENSRLYSQAGEGITYRRILRVSQWFKLSFAVLCKVDLTKRQSSMKMVFSHQLGYPCAH